MNEQIECLRCGIDYTINADEILIRDGVEPKFCPFCGADQDEEPIDWEPNSDWEE